MCLLVCFSLSLSFWLTVLSQSLGALAHVDHAGLILRSSCLLNVGMYIPPHCPHPPPLLFVILGKGISILVNFVYCAFNLYFINFFLFYFCNVSAQLLVVASKDIKINIKG